jgi:N-acetylneuraminate synthase/N,N'-diacetyllegionaminate synthase
MHLFGKDLENDVAVVAEVGVNHEGNADVAAKLIYAAADAGADAVKLQSYTPDRFISAADKDRFARVSKFRLDDAAHERLLAVAKERGIALFSTAVTEDTVPLLARLFPAIKVASGDLDFEPVIRSAAATGKPVIISTGNATLDEVDRAVAWCRDVLGDGIKERVALMHCVASYPAPIAQANVRSVAFMRQRYGLTTGYSNHVIETEAVLAAVALGAQLIEVHFTDRKSDRTFRDHSLSFEPQELAALVQSIRRVRESLGSYDKRPQPSEEPSRAAIRKGLVAARDLAAGTVLAEDDIMYARPATEFAARERPAVVGGTLRADLKRGQVIPRDAVDVKS